MALADRVPVAAIAAATEIKSADVKRFGSGHTEHHFSGTSHELHLAGLAAIARELRAAMNEKDLAERQLRSDVVEALRSGQMDVCGIAALTAVTAERVRELMRGAVLKPVPSGPLCPSPGTSS